MQKKSFVLTLAFIVVIATSCAPFVGVPDAEAYQFYSQGKCYTSGYIFGSATLRGVLTPMRYFQVWDIHWDPDLFEEYLRQETTIVTNIEAMSDELRAADGTGHFISVVTRGGCGRQVSHPIEVRVYTDPNLLDF